MASEQRKVKIVREEPTQSPTKPITPETKIQPSIPRKSYSDMAKASNPDKLVSIDFGFVVRNYNEGELVTSDLAEPADIKKSYSPMAKPDLEKLMAS